MLDIAAVCLVITALLAYLNHRFTRLPTTIGVMAGALGLSLALIGLDAIGWFHQVRDYEQSLLQSIDFSEVLLEGMLSVLLFAAAMHIDLAALRAFRTPVLCLALGGTLLSTAIVGCSLWLLLPYAGMSLPLLPCLVFGALISPTDPIAVLGILKSAGAPKDVELVMSGESLFNDGIGVVVFSLLLGMMTSGEAPTLAHGAGLLLREVGGGGLLGVGLGWITYVLIKSIDQYQVEVLLTLAAVIGGYALAQHLHVSGPLAMVIAGLIIGNHGRERAMSTTTRQNLDLFWELIDEILNAVLFVLIGMEVIVIVFPEGMLDALLLALAVTLLARVLAVGLPVRLMRKSIGLPPGAATVLSWGGLRGGISVALALSLPQGAARELLVPLTYGIVVFSVLVQGLTIGHVVRRSLPQPDRVPEG